MAFSTLKGTRGVVVFVVGALMSVGTAIADDGADTGLAETLRVVFDSEPGKLTAGGITIYGIVDYNIGYMSHGTPTNPDFYPGNQYLISKNANKSEFFFTNNAMSQSLVGLKGTEDLGEISGASILSGWSAVFDLQMGFNPAFGTIADAPGAQSSNNGVALEDQDANAGGSRAGQIFNGEAYGGVKHKDLGEIRYGRNNTVLLDAISQYDPQKMSYANSPLGYSGTYGGGFGITENARWNNSIKYKNTIGPVRVGAHYRFGSYGQGEEYYALALGIDGQGALKPLSIDGVWGRQKSAITASALTAADCIELAPGSDCTELDVLNGTVTDTEAYALMAKYKFGEDLTVYGGWEHVNYANPDHEIESGYTFIGNYTLFKLNNTNYTTDRETDLYWVGGRYNFTPKLVAAAAWYHLDQHSFVSKDVPCTTSGQDRTKIQPNCAGSLDALSFTLDYQWTKRLDIYGGVMYSTVDGGLSSGFLNTETITPTAGARYRF